MSDPSSPGNGGGQPLQPVSLNTPRDSHLFSPNQQERMMMKLGESAPARDSSVHERVHQYNAMEQQKRALERKAADAAMQRAALQRAILGREEAEAEMRRYQDEANGLKGQLKESKERETEVTKRFKELKVRFLHQQQENYDRFKEMHLHAEDNWKQQGRRAHKERCKEQSALVGAQSALAKAQEELKNSLAAQNAAEEQLCAERDRADVREQEAFDAQSNMIALQEKLDRALGRAKMLEQELETIRVLSREERKVTRAASESEQENSDKPRKRARRSSVSEFASGDPEIETMTMLWEWEKQRANRALEQVDFLQAECELKMCAASKDLRRMSVQRSSTRKRNSMLISDAGDTMILSESRPTSASESRPASSEGKPGYSRRTKTELYRKAKKEKEKASRRSTIFLPEEGIFRTVSEAEAEAMLAARSIASSGVTVTDSSSGQPITPTDSDPLYRRSPSVEPPDFAVGNNKERTSLLSLLNAPHRQEPTPVFNIPTTPGPVAEEQHAHHQQDEQADEAEEKASTLLATTSHYPAEHLITIPEPTSSLSGPLTDPLPSTRTSVQQPARPHTTTAHYPTTTTTTKVPLRSEPTADDPPTLAQRLLKAQRTPSRQTGRIGEEATEGDLEQQGEAVDPDRPSFDASNPAMTPTMTREEALAQIRERRGRTRSVGRVGSGGSSSAEIRRAESRAAGDLRRTESRTAGRETHRRTESRATGELRRTESRTAGHTAGGGENVRRKVSAGTSQGSAAAEGVRRKVSSGELRGRDRDVRREVSAPSATGHTAATAARAAAGVGGGRRIRS
ncbi:uncharacterized protein C8A04DRAFT_13583 [Dichotomopilus funicola]|uniref:Uncharacterized protein n=1 Tax=Dichotomopilus funicola TaxID=1934379 RepID=A0AAN6UZP0_9PEZI|nr:hypothetical protein C8A04DRAFT_13583 [Dichotomopilus funicola]